MKLVKLILLLNGAMHLYFGLVFMFTPEDMMAQLSIAATSPDGMTEMRTFYGGLMFAMGCFFVLGIFDPTTPDQRYSCWRLPTLRRCWFVPMGYSCTPQKRRFYTTSIILKLPA